jgi:hypothetical protein
MTELKELKTNEAVAIEEPYFDERGFEIKEHAVIKMFHFKGVNEQGRGRKNYYMYKWVKLKQFQDKKYWVALHLTNDSGDYFHFRGLAKGERKLKGVEVVQQYDARWG